jgi:hypothetical protein
MHVEETRRNVAGRSISLYHDDDTGQLVWASRDRDGPAIPTLGDAHRAIAAYEKYADTLMGAEETDWAGVFAGTRHSVRRDPETGAEYCLTFVAGKLVDIEPAAKARRRTEFERSLSAECGAKASS